MLPNGSNKRLGVIVAAAAVALVVAVISGGGSALFTHTQSFLDFGAGVLALVSLSVTVLWGLAATDRMVLHSKHRLLAQAVHRATAVAGLCFLGLHIWVKVAEQSTPAAAVFIPGADPSQRLLVGLGTIAGYGFVLVAVTGAMRHMFATPARARRWRMIHWLAYLMWCISLVHGLKAGRPAKGYATVMYLMCLIGVAAALVIRLRYRNPIGAKGPVVNPPKDLPRPPERGRREQAALPPRPSQSPAGLLEGGALPPGRGGGQPWDLQPQDVRGYSLPQAPDPLLAPPLTRVSPQQPSLPPGEPQPPWATGQPQQEPPYQQQPPQPGYQAGWGGDPQTSVMPGVPQAPDRELWRPTGDEPQPQAYQNPQVNGWAQ